MYSRHLCIHGWRPGGTPPREHRDCRGRARVDALMRFCTKRDHSQEHLCSRFTVSRSKFPVHAYPEQ